MFKKILALSLSLVLTVNSIHAVRPLDLMKRYPNMSGNTVRFFANTGKVIQLSKTYSSSITHDKVPAFLSIEAVYEAIATSPEMVKQLKKSLEQLEEEMEMVGTGTQKIYSGRAMSNLNEFVAKLELSLAKENTLNHGKFKSHDETERFLKKPLQLYKELTEFLKILETKQETSNAADIKFATKFDDVETFYNGQADKDCKAAMIKAEARALDEGQDFIYIKRLYPFMKLIEHFLPHNVSLLNGLRIRIEKAEHNFAALQLYLNAFQESYQRYRELCEDKNEIADDVKQEFECFFKEKIAERDEKLSNLQTLIAAEYDAVDEKVAAYYEQAKLLKPQAKASKKKAKDHKKIVEAIKFEREERKKAEVAAAAREAEIAAELKASRQQARARKFATNEAAYHEWYWASQSDHSLMKEAHALAQKRLAAEQAKADAKAAKSHEIDESKASSSTSEITKEKKKVDDNDDEQEELLLSHAHEQLLDDLFDDEQKDSGIKIETIGRLFVSLGGYIDPTRTGCRQALAIRNRETGHLITRVIHYHAKNGRKALRPEQVLEIRTMLIEAGYTPDMVISSQ